MKPRTLRRRLLIEATIALLLARFAVRVMPAEKIVSWASRSPRRPDRFTPTTLIQAICRTVDEVGERPWMRAVCLPKAIAAQAMLRRRGVGGHLCLGAGRKEGELAAHAWLELEQDVIIGGNGGLDRCTRLVSFG